MRRIPQLPGNTVLLCEANAEVIGLSPVHTPSLFLGGVACLIEVFVVEEGYRRRAWDTPCHRAGTPR